MAVAGIFHQPFAEQLAYFRRKLNLPTQFWDDILGSAHDQSFIVAGAWKAELLDDLRKAIDKAIGDGTTLDEFRRDFRKIVAEHGWDYRGGFDWRTRVIYATNLRTSYQAGRYAQMTDPKLVKLRPYWRYKHNDSVRHPRPLHLSWDGVTLRWDDPWWKTHFTPNGWGCKCRVVSLRKGQVPDGPDEAPDNGTYRHVDRNGVVHTLPTGVDYGWDHAPGMSVADEVRASVVDGAAALHPKLKAALLADIKR